MEEWEGVKTNQQKPQTQVTNHKKSPKHQKPTTPSGHKGDFDLSKCTFSRLF